MLIFEVNFDNLRRKKELVWFRLFATTFSPLGLTLFNLIFVLLAIEFFLSSHTSSYLKII
jgi:hypothetical protein